MGTTTKMKLIFIYHTEVPGRRENITPMLPACIYYPFSDKTWTLKNNTTAGQNASNLITEYILGYQNTNDIHTASYIAFCCLCWLKEERFLESLIRPEGGLKPKSLMH